MARPKGARNRETVLAEVDVAVAAAPGLSLEEKLTAVAEGDGDLVVRLEALRLLFAQFAARMTFQQGA